LNNSFETGTELAGIGKPSGDGKWLLFPQHCPSDFDDLDEPGGSFFSMPHVHSFPLQHGHEQWLEAADNAFQPLLRVNG
jgi:hypothetical protein